MPIWTDERRRKLEVQIAEEEAKVPVDIGKVNRMRLLLSEMVEDKDSSMGKAEPREVRRERTPPGMLAALAKRMIEDIGRPLTIGEILMEFRIEGFIFEKDVDERLQAGLTALPDIFCTVEEGYWLADREVPRTTPEKRTLN